MQLSFLPELAPHVASLKDSRDQAWLLDQALIRYLHATSVLELCVVTRVASSIAHGAMPFQADAQSRRDAIGLCHEESAHAIGADRLLEERGADPNPLMTPAFMVELGRLNEVYGHDALVNFLFTVVTETCVSANLRRLGSDPRMDPHVASFVRGHARDEAAHAIYFGRLFAHFWVNASPGTKKFSERLLPSLARAFVTPDAPAIRSDLACVGISPSDAERIYQQTYNTENAYAVSQRTIKPLLVHLHRAGALNESMRSGFTAARLLES